MIRMRWIVSHARTGRVQTIYRTINATDKSERVAEGAAIIAMAFANEVAVAA